MPYKPDDPIYRSTEKYKTLLADKAKSPTFDGWTFVPELDHRRLTSQMQRVKAVMSDGHWRTLDELSMIAGGSEASISARLRDLRKERHGSMTVERRRRGEETRGLFEYRLAK